MFKRSTQGVEAYMYAGSGLGWFQWVTSGAFPGGHGRSWHFRNVNQLL